MIKLLKAIIYTLGSLVGLLIVVLIVAIVWMKISTNSTARKALALAGPEVQTITADGLTFRDLNKNGKLDLYEDKRENADERTDDLLSQMTLEEKAGTMFITMISMKKDGSLV